MRRVELGSGSMKDKLEAMEGLHGGDSYFRGWEEVSLVIITYAPTRTANRKEKDAFYDDLETQLAGIPDSDMYIMIVLLGDFNARIGSRESAQDQWGC